jgi:hypothetical protein
MMNTFTANDSSSSTSLLIISLHYNANGGATMPPNLEIRPEIIMNSTSIPIQEIDKRGLVKLISCSH